MATRFTVLAQRLAARGLSWHQVQAVLLTHVHSDHWKPATLAYLARLQIPFYCHPSQADNLARWAPAFARMRDAGLVLDYQTDRTIPLGPALHALPLALSHDGGETFGFRFEGGTSLFGPSWTLGYAADLGYWDTALVQAFAGMDALALEFNHDVELQRTSGRSPQLIERVLGDRGHLSNVQAGEFLQAILRESPRSAVRTVVALHLSRECNRPALARAAAAQALRTCDRAAQVVIASQHEPGPTLSLEPGAERRTMRRPPPEPGQACA